MCCSGLINFFFSSAHRARLSHRCYKCVYVFTYIQRSMRALNASHLILFMSFCGCICGKKKIRKVLMFTNEPKRERERERGGRRKIYWFWSKSSRVSMIGTKREWSGEQFLTFSVLSLSLSKFKLLSETTVSRRAGEGVFSYFTFLVRPLIDWFLSSLHGRHLIELVFDCPLLCTPTGNAGKSWGQWNTWKLFRLMHFSNNTLSL
jgi:hypothetical protein